MTRKDHKNYIASEWWLQRRKLFLESHDECNRCGVERETARELYDQDLNVHHRNYQNKGAEKDEDLEALCRRCHEIESKGKSSRPRWSPNFPIFQPSDWMKWKTERDVFRIQCPQCGFECNHFTSVPVFIQECRDEPSIKIPLVCESSHRWDLMIEFDHGSIYAYPYYVGVVEECETLR